MKTVDAEEFRNAMSATATGVTVITTDGTAGRAGVTVSTLCSLSLEPPSVILCIHRDSRALGPILENGVFAANVLAEGQERVADSFAGRIPELRDNRFAAGSWDVMTTDAPMLQGAGCAFDCKIAEVFEFGSHRIIAGIVVGLAQNPALPLVHAQRAYQRLKAA